MRYSALFLAALVALPAAAERTHDITIDDYYTLALPLSATWSPDGKWIAYVDLRWDADTKKRNGDIWLVDASTKKSRRLTFDPGFDSHPVFSPDSTQLYFQSGRAGKGQVWRVDLDGKNLKQVTRLASGVNSFHLGAKGDRLYLATPKKATDKPWKGLKQKFSALKYGHGVWTYTVIEVLDLNTWRLETLIDENRVLVGWDVAPDGKRIAMITRPTNELISNEGWSTVDVWDAKTGKVTSLADKAWRDDAPSPYGWLDAPSWSADSRALAFTVDFDGYPGELFVANFATDGSHTLHKLARPNGSTLNSGATPQWRGTSKDLLYGCERRARVRVCMTPGADSAGATGYALTGGDVVVGAFDVDDAGENLAFTLSSPTTFGDVYRSEIRKDNPEHTQLTVSNPQTADWKLPPMKVVSWKSTDGETVEGILTLPPGADPKKPLPMLVYIHGGPASSAKYRLRYWGYGRTIMAAKGYATFSPNYRGSTGYGDKFLVDLIGRKNDIDVKDILSGVDAMVAQGVADKDKLGVMGWSNGGYLTNCIITQTTRFKAASSGAGVFDTAMQWMIEDTPGHVVNYQKGLPWENPESMRRSSPLYSVDKVKTPTLIHVGEDDPRVPLAHSKALHRSLHQYLKVPVELVIYPKTGHSLSKWTHRRAKMEWDLAWFKKYILAEKKAAAK